MGGVDTSSDRQKHAIGPARTPERAFNPLPSASIHESDQPASNVCATDGENLDRIWVMAQSRKIIKEPRILYFKNSLKKVVDI
jgi:hypothetical protein